jgi:cytochrome c5
MKRRLISFVALILLLGACAVVMAQTASKSPANDSNANQGRTATATTSEGEKRFQINCGRCHNAPEDISPREARAVVRHMRVRAMLSAEDEKLILEFLAP